MKKIVFSCNPIVNLILHVICCFDPSFPRKPIYAEKAQEWLQPDEKKYFEDNFRSEQTGKVSSTGDFAFLFQIPAYFSADTIESLGEVVELMKTGTLTKLKDHFPEKRMLLDAYLPEHLQRLFFEKAIKKRNNCEKTLYNYGKILENVYERFYGDYWKTIVPVMDKRADLLNEKYFSKYNVIELWEEKTCLQFPYTEFVVELADPISSLGTSLMAERGAFSHWVSLEEIFTVISHEIGTHIFFQTSSFMSPSYAKIFESNAEETLRIVEALSYLTNLGIWKEEKILSVGYSGTFEKHFSDEIETLQRHWSFWENGELSSVDLIVRVFNTLRKFNH